jgi:hypothetical protein
MSFLRKPKTELESTPPPEGALPVKLLDTSKRYDLYCNTSGEDRLYENVKPQKHQFRRLSSEATLKLKGRMDHGS